MYGLYYLTLHFCCCNTPDSQFLIYYLIVFVCVMSCDFTLLVFSDFEWTLTDSLEGFWAETWLMQTPKEKGVSGLEKSSSNLRCTSWIFNYTRRRSSVQSSGWNSNSVWLLWFKIPAWKYASKQDFQLCPVHPGDTISLKVTEVDKSRQSLLPIGMSSNIKQITFILGVKLTNDLLCVTQAAEVPF